MWVITGRKAEVSFRHDWSRESMRGRGCVNLDGGGDGVGYWGLGLLEDATQCARGGRPATAAQPADQRMSAVVM